MDTLRHILYFWNDWIVYPAGLIVVLHFSVKFRKVSLAIVAAGIAIFVFAKLIESFVLPQYADSNLKSLLIHQALWIAGLISLVMCISAGAWFALRDYPAIKRQSNLRLNTDARQETPRAG